MISKGSLAAPLRKLELTKLEELLTPLTPAYDPPMVPLRKDDDFLGYSADIFSEPATASKEPKWYFWDTDMTVGISPTKLLDLAAKLDVDDRRRYRMDDFYGW
jgi:hypothetical protein